MDKVDIMDRAREIGTYETSIEPYEDCCTVFTPRHPATHPKMDKILEGESHLDEEALIQRALEGTEVIRV
jgi:thiamine biosynthesis protein ThiI